MQVPVGYECPEVPQKPESNEVQRQKSQQLIDCLHQLWQPAMARIGIDLDKPRLHTYEGDVETRCGMSSGTSFYCPPSAETVSYTHLTLPTTPYV